MSNKKYKTPQAVVWNTESAGFKAGVLMHGYTTELATGRSEAAALEGLIAALIALQYSTVLLLAEAKSREHKIDIPDRPLLANEQCNGV